MKMYVYDNLNHKRIKGVGSRGPGQIEVGGRGREDRLRVEDKLLCLDEGLGGGGVLDEERLPRVEVGRGWQQSRPPCVFLLC